MQNIEVNNIDLDIEKENVDIKSNDKINSDINSKEYINFNTQALQKINLNDNLIIEEVDLSEFSNN